MFPDHFSDVAGDYARFRPEYPDALFTWLASTAPATGRAWDCATGNGQAARGLARHFLEVVATDAAPAQIAAARGPGNIRFDVAPAEASGLPARSVDLATVAQAAHWFATPEFHAELRRVLRPGGLAAIWCYGITEADAGMLDRVLRWLHDEVLAPFWPAERQHVVTGYRELSFPFPELAVPAFVIERDWRRDELVGYVGTWSAVRQARRAGRDPMPAFADELARVWPETGTLQRIRWPIHLRVGRRA